MPPRKKEPVNPVAEARAAMVAKARSAIQKSTKQKPLEPTATTIRTLSVQVSLVVASSKSMGPSRVVRQPC
jgi:hypothetical protein